MKGKSEPTDKGNAHKTVDKRTGIDKTDPDDSADTSTTRGPHNRDPKDLNQAGYIDQGRPTRANLGQNISATDGNAAKTEGIEGIDAVTHKKMGLSDVGTDVSTQKTEKTDQARPKRETAGQNSTSIDTADSGEGCRSGTDNTIEPHKNDTAEAPEVDHLSPLEPIPVHPSQTEDFGIGKFPT